MMDGINGNNNTKKQTLRDNLTLKRKWVVKKYGDRGLLVKDSIGGNIFPMLRF